MRIRICFAALALLALAGCPKKKEAVPDAAPVVAVDVPDTAPVATVEEDAAPVNKTDPDWVPMHTDDDTKAKKEISRTSYKQELDTLDKEITAEK